MRQDKTGTPVCRICSIELNSNNWLPCFQKQNYWKCQPCSRLQFNENKRKWAANNTESILLHHAKARANKLNLAFNIDLEDVEIPEICPVLGIPLIVNKGKKGAGPNSPTLDRIVPEKGYIKGNIAVISHKANTIKNDATIDELEKVLTWFKQQTGKNYV